MCERDGDPPFAECSFIRRLCVLGAGIGLDVFAFAPWTWEPADDTVKGWSWSERSGRWVTARKTAPGVVYDRAWPGTAEERNRCESAIRRLREARRFAFLNGRLPHKAKVQAALARDAALAAVLPPTSLYRGAPSLASWLRKHRRAAFLKPVGGSQGKRVIAVLPEGGAAVRLTGRDANNRPLSRRFASEADAVKRLERWIGRRGYLMQPMLDLVGSLGEPYDLRVLTQKNERGRWAITGVAARLGAPGSVTSNLHGGGTAAPAEETLRSLFGERRGRELLEAVRDYSFKIVACLEQSFGRFAEIGLDFGIERNGKLWFLEANSKPGRAAMDSAGRESAYAAAMRPLSYARSILLRPPGRVIHEFDHV
ncbi:YheC/YheD family protein [Paenibacillaceae bacterium WGS1546]|uniref:YheC/YheD family endospore coat-associated protein n=1 Tax=Cohnella sp. WGS1546 TaxID=3366810 RepID=UPI00372D14D9